jgi:hypothetical protein
MACSLYVLLAPKVRRAVILRRGPSKQVLLLTWDLRTDKLTPGQWFKGRVYERRCDLSPTGDLFLYFAASQKPPYRTWTALSRPPYFTALALWPKGDTWGGGGLFVGSQAVALNHAPPLTPAEGFPYSKWPATRLDAHAGRGEDAPMDQRRLIREGWVLTQQGQEIKHSYDSPLWYSIDPPQIFARPSRKVPDIVLRSLLTGIKERDGRMYRRHHELWRGDEHAVLPKTEWADWDTNGDLLFSREGELFRLGGAAARRLDVGQAKLIADLTPLKFENRPPPKNYR